MNTIDTIKWGGILAGGAYGYLWLQDRFDQGTQEASARIIQASEDMEYELQEFGNLSESEIDSHIEEYEGKLDESASLLRERAGEEYQIMGTSEAQKVFGDSDKETYAFGLKLLTSYNDAVTLADEESNKNIAERVFEWIDEEHPWLGPLILGGGGLVGVYYGKQGFDSLVERYTDEYGGEEPVAESITAVNRTVSIPSTSDSLYDKAAQYEVQMIEAEPDPSQPPSEQPTPQPGEGVEAPAKEMNRWLPDNIVGKVATVLAVGPMTVITLTSSGVDFIVNNTSLTRGELTAGLAITIALIIVAAIVIEYGTGPIPAGTAFLTTALSRIGVKLTGSAGRILSGFKGSWVSGLGVTI